ncbi:MULTISPECIES: universal stress protein [unclassified Halorhabdus]|uniref:universal stress protein n=1 Tax=unclassified Halorhabdus TaxID=2621901 RepID=UPI0023DB5615|nr:MULTISPECIES: universal stress protein [unclassified Halorhabdus]WEL17021.1 Nucleotide-binding protein, UspA family [Halorhabdus sp. SVX81]WEL20904.1 Nucleotide-binding protein, UspA family [Halorhabdus sp. BNX81]
MYDRILVPTDGSDGIEPVIEHALELAAVHNATVHGLYVLDTATMSRMPMDTSWEAVSGMLREEAEQALTEIEELAGEAVTVETTLVEGAPSREIVARAENAAVDLIVMGTHGRGGLNRLLLGSVAERVIRSAPVPVLTYRVGEPPEVRSPEE